MPVSLLAFSMSLCDDYSYNKTSIMQFCRIGSVIEPRENAQLLFDRPCKSPTRSHLPKSDPLQGEPTHHIRVQSAFFSPSPSSPALRKLECRPISPLALPHQERLLYFNPETPKSQRISDQNLDAAQQQKVSTKLRKNSENFLLHNRAQREEAQSDDKEQSFGNFLTPKAPEKYRKGSCQLLQVPAFFKKSRKNSTNEQAIAAPKKAGKGKGWDETNNFQLSTNHSEENSGPDLTHSLIEQPRLHTQRKHSDNCNVRKVPAFLSPRAPRKSFDYVLRSGASIQDFLIVKQLGKGAFGRVVLAVEKRTGLACAIKILAKREVATGGMAEQVARQLKLQMFVSHPNVVKVYGYFDDLLHFYIIMECALDGHLSDLLARKPAALAEQEAAVLFHQTCSAVSVLHRYSIIHRDLKPENLLMHQGIIKISDFGWSVQRGSGLRTTFCGTPLYLSPQVLLGDEYDESVDIWALGVILYEMLSKENPFRITCQEQLGRILDSPVTFSEGISSSAKQLIEACLAKRAHQRPNIRELMLHEFVLRGVAAQQLKR